MHYPLYCSYTGYCGINMTLYVARLVNIQFLHMMQFDGVLFLVYAICGLKFIDCFTPFLMFTYFQNLLYKLIVTDQIVVAVAFFLLSFYKYLIQRLLRMILRIPKWRLFTKL